MPVPRVLIRWTCTYDTYATPCCGSRLALGEDQYRLVHVANRAVAQPVTFVPYKLPHRLEPGPANQVSHLQHGARSAERHHPAVFLHGSVEPWHRAAYHRQ